METNLEPEGEPLDQCYPTLSCKISSSFGFSFALVNAAIVHFVFSVAHRSQPLPSNDFNLGERLTVDRTRGDCQLDKCFDCSISKTIEALMGPFEAVQCLDSE